MKAKQTLIAIGLSLVLVSCESGTYSNEYEATYTDYEDLEAEVACLRDLIYYAETDLSDAQGLLSDIEGEFYWIDETSAWYPEDIYDLENLIDEADEAFVAIDNTKIQLGDLSSIIQDVQSSLTYSSC